MTLKIFFKSLITNKKGGLLAPLPYYLRTLRTEDSKGIRPAEAVTLTSLVTDVTGVEVAVHAVLQRSADEVLQTVRHVGQQEPAVGVSQEVVNAVTLRN